MAGKIFNISAANSFVDEVAVRFLEEYKDKPLELSEVLFLLSSRRAAESLRRAFVRAKGQVPTLLPKFIPIGDMSEEEVFFSNVEEASKLKPVISKLERLLLFTKIILSKPKEFGITDLSSKQACFLAKELAELIDLVNNEGLTFDRLKDLVPEEYSLYWQETLKFLEIITRFWPEILKERDLADPGFRKNMLLKMQAEIWEKSPPKTRIVAAGITATFPLMKRMVKTVSGLPNGEVILAGLDKHMDDEDWEAVDASHPQFELKELLDYLDIHRSKVEELVPAANEARAALVSEIMRPSKTTDKWREIKDRKIPAGALQGLTLINCADVRIEALSIALIMRESLETPEATAALVTTDRNLSRRVAAELKRWGIDIDDSAGRPLSLTPVGQFMRLIADAVENEFSAVAMLSLMKHPFTLNGLDYAAFRKKVRDFELKVLRSGKEDEDGFGTEFSKVFEGLNTLFRQGKASFRELLGAHVEIARKLASDDVLWKGEAGEACAVLIADLYEKADELGEIAPGQYSGMLEALMAGVTIRPKYGTHPRLSILGPIEARLMSFDTLIVGEVNEGSWPKSAAADPWLSRQMKEKFGLPLPEKAIGIAAQDFANLISNSRVYLTRAERVQGTPMVKSRWWMRLETVLKALGLEAIELEDAAYKQWARYLDRVEVFKKILPPEPKPPVSARPRELPVSAIENLMRDPYIIFAKYILKLKPLDELERELGAAEYGSMVHGILEEFNHKHKTSFPKNAREELLALGEKYFEENQVAGETKAFWRPNFEKTVDWLVSTEEAYRPDIKEVFSEVSGRYRFEMPAGEFCVTAKADRVDVTKDGKVNIIDYKTGQIRSEKDLFGGYSPQLPIEGLIASHGGFEGVAKADVEKLIYWQLGKEERVFEKDLPELTEINYENLRELIALFDFETTPYYSKPNPKLAPKYSDYEHLSRAKEWSVAEDSIK